MKNIFIFMLCLVATSFLSTSCEKLSLPEGESSETNEAQKLKVVARSTTNDITYPLTVFAFSADGSCAAKQSLNSSSEELSLSLSSGSYHIVALSNTEGYTIPSSPTLTSLVQVTDANNYATSPLQMGQADVTVGSTSQTVNVTLSYKVATINMSLSSLSSSVTSVSVTVAQEYSSMDLSGEYSSPKNSTFQLTKSGDNWTGNVYVLPGASSQTVFTISLTGTTGTTSYAYTYNKPLIAATPYNISGNYSSGTLNVSASFINEGWNTPIELAFNFGPNGQGGEVTPTEKVSSFPTAGSVWNGHIVAYVYDDSGNILSDSDTENCTSINLLLLSLSEWTKVNSAASTTNPTEATDYASSYVEDDLTDWTIPTEDEVLNLINLYNVSHDETMTAINNTITSAGGTAIAALDDDDKNIRYLCEEGTKAFTWRLSPNILSAGATVKYSLRLVNHVKVMK